MKIIEPEKMICKVCNKELKDAKEGFGIPVFKGFHFEREWTCLECFNDLLIYKLNKNLIKKE